MPAGATPLTIVGSLGGDPEIREAGSSRVATFSVAVTERKKEGDQWVDGATTWFRCNAWDELGEHVAGSLSKGTRVVVTGTIGERKYEDRDGNQKSSWEVTCDEVAPSLKYATATVTRIQRGQQQGRGGQRPAQPVRAGSAPVGGQQQAWAADGYADEEPF